MIIDEILDEEVEKKLESILISNDFENDASAYTGFVDLFIEDLKENPEMNFPLIIVQPESEDVTNRKVSMLKLAMQVSIIGVIEKRQDKPVKALCSLLRDVRKSLNNEDDYKKALSIDYQGTVFNLLGDNKEYPSFELKITINYVEQMK